MVLFEESSDIKDYYSDDFLKNIEDYIGRTSGGGACVIQQGVTADGTLFSISSNIKSCTVKNGSFYPIDQGVEPDFTIGAPAHFYDRQWLTDYINSLP